MSEENSYQPETLAVRAGTEHSQFHEHSEALFLTSSFVFDNAEQAAKRFIGEEPGNIYARFTNPTVTMFEQRLAATGRSGAMRGDLVRHGRHPVHLHGAVEGG